jgi:hypothetical protein
MSGIIPIVSGMGTSWKRSPCQIWIVRRITSPSWMITRAATSSLEFIPIKLLVAECEVHPEMMEGAAECPLRLQPGRKGEHEALQLVHSHAWESQEHRRAGLQASARATSHRGASFPQRYHVR